MEKHTQATEIVPRPQPHQQVLIHKHDERAAKESYVHLGDALDSSLGQGEAREEVGFK